MRAPLVRTPAAQLGRRAVDWDLGAELAGDAEVIRQLHDHPTGEMDSNSRGGLALLLLDAGLRVELPILEALPHAFYSPRSPAAQRADAKLRELLSDDATRDLARAALVAGSENDDSDIQSACRELLEEAGLLETTRTAG